MNRRQPLISHAQMAKLVQPCDGALHHPSGRAQIAAVRSATPGDLMLDATFFQGLPMLLTIVPAIGLHPLWFMQWPAAFARDGSNSLYQRHELGDVMPVCLGQNDIDRHALRVDEKVVFAPRLTAIGWVRSSFFPPCTARTEELSATTREKSSLSAPRSLTSSTRCSRVHTPAFCQAGSRLSRSCRSHRPSLAAAFPMVCLTVIRTGSPSVHADRPAVCVQDASCADA